MGNGFNHDNCDGLLFYDEFLASAYCKKCNRSWKIDCIEKITENCTVTECKHEVWE